MKQFILICLAFLAVPVASAVGEESLCKSGYVVTNELRTKLIFPDDLSIKELTWTKDLPTVRRHAAIDRHLFAVAISLGARTS